MKATHNNIVINQWGPKAAFLDNALGLYKNTGTTGAWVANLYSDNLGTVLTDADA